MKIQGDILSYTKMVITNVVYDGNNEFV